MFGIIPRQILSLARDQMETCLLSTQHRNRLLLSPMRSKTRLPVGPRSSTRSWGQELRSLRLSELDESATAWNSIHSMSMLSFAAGSAARNAKLFTLSRERAL